MRSFNPRAREGRDVFLLATAQDLRGFNPRAREGRDPRFSSAAAFSGEFQSTRPRGARQNDVSSRASVRVVSIHAPARGATATLTRA